jgi:cysteine dioxygenase
MTFFLPLPTRCLVANDLQAMFDYLDDLSKPPALAELLDRLSRFEIDIEDVLSHVRFSDRNYQRNLLRAGENYHAWVLCWKNGQRSPIHDHAGSSCVVRVLRGTLTETIFEFAPNGHVKASFSRDAAEGSILASEDSDMHQISNLQADDADLVTLHVYAPPLLAMNTYTLQDRTRGVEIWEVEFSDAAGI